MGKSRCRAKIRGDGKYGGEGVVGGAEGGTSKKEGKHKGGLNDND